MDSTASSREENAPPPAGDGASSVKKVELEQQHPEALPDAGVHSVNAARAAVKVEDGGEEEDEQVERFFALLANIRALRGMYGAAVSGGGSSSTTGRGRKRAQEAEPPWRPAFRLEDFALARDEEVAAGKKKRMEGMGGTRRLPVGTSTGAVADDGEGVGEVVEETRGRSTGSSVLTDDRAAS